MLYEVITPENLKYTKDHEWIRVDGDTALVGVTDYAQGELGDIVFIEIETLGEVLTQGDIFGSIDVITSYSIHYTKLYDELNRIARCLDRHETTVPVLSTCGHRRYFAIHFDQ